MPVYLMPFSRSKTPFISFYHLNLFESGQKEICF